MRPQPPSHNATLVDQTGDRALWKVKHGSRTIWVIALPDGVVDRDAPLVSGYQGNYMKKRDAMSAWNQVKTDKVAAGGEAHAKSLALMKFLSGVSKSLGPQVGRHVYVVGGAVRDFVLDRPIKDVDVVIDSVALGGRKDSEWFAKQVERAVPAPMNVVTNQYGVVLMKVLGDWVLDGMNMQGEEIEIANARKESYGGEEGKGYKPHMVEPATIEDDVVRRELTYNTLLLRLIDLANGPDKKDIVDLTGCGLRDLEEGVMQCPRDPNIVFSDDPSRMIRVIKYALRYGHKLTPDTLTAIRQNATKLKNIPSSHLSQLLTQIVLKESTWKKALEMMSDLYLLEPVREMILEDKGFRSTMENYVNSQKMDMLFGLVDVGLPLGAAINFLDSSEQTRLREIALSMERDDAWEFLGMLKNPGNAWKDKKFMPSLAREHGFLGKGMRTFAPEVSRIGRELLLEDPGLAYNPSKFKQLVTREVDRMAPQLRRASRTTLSTRDYEDQLPGGLADKSKPSDFDQDELASGIKVEMEHVDDVGLAREIAMDHLKEIPDYYTRLQKMEDAADGKRAKKLDTVWVVTDPTQHSEIVDILFGTSNMKTLGNVIRGSMDWGKSNPALHDDLRSARDDAEERLRRLYRGDVPEWVYDSDGQGFKMASTSKVAVPEKYKHIDFKPPQSVADAAAKGLEYRRKADEGEKGGLTTEEAGEKGIGSGVQRAVNLKNRDEVTPETIGKMVGFFARHEKNKGVDEEHEGEPWNDAGYVAWLLWGGDPGKRWAEKIQKQMEEADEKEKQSKQAKQAASSGVLDLSGSKTLNARDLKRMSSGDLVLKAPTRGNRWVVYKSQGDTWVPHRVFRVQGDFPDFVAAPYRPGGKDEVITSLAPGDSPYASDTWYEDLKMGLIRSYDSSMFSRSVRASENEPTDPALWEKAVSKAKEKYDKYPSAYANGWAVQWYNDQGGGWRKKKSARGKAKSEKAHTDWSQWGPTLMGDPVVVSEMKTAAVADYIPGKGKSVGLFIKLPDGLAEMFPELENDKSHSHVTLLYVGEVAKAREEEFLKVLRETLSKEPGPIRAWLNGIDHFVHPDKDRKVFYTPVRFSRDVAELRDKLWVKLEEAGFDVQHSFPLAFFPHVTLAYMQDAHDAVYEGPVPSGAWEFDSLQVWGLPEVHDIRLGGYDTENTTPWSIARVASMFTDWDFLE